MTDIVGGRNPALTRVRRLARDRALRRREGVYLVEGPTLVVDALSAGREVEQVFVPAEAASSAVATASETSGVPCRLVDDALFDGLTTTMSAQPAIAVVARHDVSVPDLPADGVVVVPYNPKCVRATAGSLFRLPFAVLEGDGAVDEALILLEASGRHCWGSVAEGGIPPTEVPDGRPIALLLGNEPHGLAEDALARCEGLVTVATTGSGDSLNVAVAGAVLLYALATR